MKKKRFYSVSLFNLRPHRDQISSPTARPHLDHGRMRTGVTHDMTPDIRIFDGKEKIIYAQESPNGAKPLRPDA